MRKVILFAMLVFACCVNPVSVDENKSYVKITHCSNTPGRIFDSVKIFVNDEIFTVLEQGCDVSFSVDSNSRITIKYKKYEINYYVIDSVINIDEDTITTSIIKTDTLSTFEKVRHWIVTADTVKWNLCIE